MAITAVERTEMVRVVVGLFDAAPGFKYLNDFIGFAGNPEGLLAALVEDPVFTTLYPVFLTNQEFAANYVNNVVGDAASAEAKADAADYMAAQLNAGATRAEVIGEALVALISTNPNDPVWGEAAKQFANKVTVAEYYSVQMRGMATDLAELQAVLANVDADSDLSNIPELISPTPVEPIGLTFRLTVGQDDITGDAGANTFNAVVAQNAMGAQVNTLGSGDYIDGAAGTDTLNAKITSGVFAGGSWSMPIQPETKSVEIVKLEAVLSDVPGVTPEDSGAVVDQVFVNAKDMEDVEQLWSNRSDADLTIMNLTTKGLEQLSDMTIGMAYTGNADTKWGASDYHVYFDQDYLTPEATRSNPSVDFLAMNEDNYDASNGTRPLEGVFFRELQFRLNGETFDLTEYMNEDPAGAGNEIVTYADFLAAVQAALVELKADNAGNAALQSVVASFGQTFRTDVDPVTLVQREGIAVRLTVDGLTDGVENNLSVLPTDLEVARAAAATAPNNNRYEIADATPPVEGAKLGINVALEKVGLAGDGGELVIGSMNKDSGNSWGAKSTTVDGTTSGINEFYVTVYGDASKSSSLAGLHSTNNNLRVVTVATDAAQTGTFANLTIGNSNTVGGNAGALKDVQVFDASAFKGDLSLDAALTSDVTAKYLDLVDTAAPAADNVAFEYTGGTGNDSFDIEISAANMAAAGTTTREDFSLDINGGSGDDSIELRIVDGDGDLASDEAIFTSPFLANWYDNSKLNANLQINAGEGDDTVWTPGSGDVVIDLGAGNDTAYTDNTGSKVAYVFNTVTKFPVHTDLQNLQSDVNDSYRIADGKLTVSFLGFEKTVDLTTNAQTRVTDLHINQAIKDAINNDAVLNKLVEATDGPANTLVVRSLVDGFLVADDLSIELSAPTTLSAGRVAQLNTAFGTSGLDAAGLIALMNAEIAAFETKGDYASTFGFNAGFNTPSIHTSDNTITGGTGNDVIVLGTGAQSNETVVYEGFGNGTDSIVNFDTGNQTVTINSEVVDGRPESFTVTFADITASVGETVAFDGVTVLLNDGVAGLVPAEDVALAFAEQYGAALAATWDVAYVPGSASITLTNNDGLKTPNTTDVVGNVETNIVAADFDFSTAANDGTVVISNYVEGLEAESWNQDATPATFTLDFDQSALGTDVVATDDGTISYLGATISYTAGDGAITLAQAFARASYTDWTAVLNPDGTTVTFTAKTAGASVTPDVNGPIGEAVDGVDPVVTGSTPGVDAVTGGGTFTETTVIELGDAGIDYLDFSDYGVAGVYVNGSLIAGDAPSSTDKLYLTLTESATNAGEYLMEVWNIGADNTLEYRDNVAPEDDVLVGTIGVADFGASQDFVAANFII